jgi:hypothetical protein
MQRLFLFALCCVLEIFTGLFNLLSGLLDDLIHFLAGPLNRTSESCEYHASFADPTGS